MNIAIAGFFIMIFSVGLMILAIPVAYYNEQRGMRYLKAGWKVFAAGMIIYLYGNVVFIFI